MPKETIEEFLKRGGKVTKGPGIEDPEQVIKKARKKYRIVYKKSRSSRRGMYVSWANPETIKKPLKGIPKKRGLLGLGLTVASLGSSIKEARKK